jgi:hypothetical protein
MKTKTRRKIFKKYHDVYRKKKKTSRKVFRSGIIKARHPQKSGCANNRHTPKQIIKPVSNNITKDATFIVNTKNVQEDRGLKMISDTESGDTLCLICGKEYATKKNSHLIPSFMIAKVCSYDGSGKRDKEVMFTMNSYEDSVYIGAVPDTKLDELFDQKTLSDERIEKELKHNTASKDYIFCPTCETNLSKYLEAPYAEYLSKGKSIKPDVAYFFWLSIVWRMSISRQFQFALPGDIEQNLGECLHEYMDTVTNEKDSTSIMEKCLFAYKLLRCPSYLPQPRGLAYFGGRYIEKEGIITLTLGDTILCAQFDKGTHSLPEYYEYLGLGNLIRSSAINLGTSPEKIVNIDNKVFEEAMNKYVQETALKRLRNQKELADKIWSEVGLAGRMPDKIFEVLMQKRYAEDTKQGDRITRERYVQLFNETLESFGYTPR